MVEHEDIKRDRGIDDCQDANDSVAMSSSTARFRLVFACLRLLPEKRQVSAKLGGSRNKTIVSMAARKEVRYEW